MMLRSLLYTLAWLLAAMPVAAQEGPTTHSRAEASAMPSFLAPSLSMHRDGSGTAWLPDASPMHALHARRGDWRLMLHGTAFLRYTHQDLFESGERGDAMLDAPNWIMGMAQRPLGRGQIAFRAMLSLDPLTIGGEGYPLLFQTGETYNGAPLIDRQHPHDFFTELAVAYARRLGQGTSVFAYVGLPGEPALGPVAFMHRPSARHNPDSPLGHHWQDATHITYGVATLGLRHGLWRIDGSVFTGREPDEARYGFDTPRFDSYSLRFSANPSARLALQVSRGFLRSPEALEPDADQWRTTASAIYHRPLGRGTWTNTLLWGMNEDADPDDAHHNDAAHGHGTLHTVLFETDFQRGPLAMYARAEWVQKPGEELGVALDETFAIGALTLGAAREVWTPGALSWSVGAQGIVYRVPEALQAVYGAQPVSAEVFLRLSPRLLRHHKMSEMP